MRTPQLKINFKPIRNVEHWSEEQRINSQFQSKLCCSSPPVVFALHCFISCSGLIGSKPNWTDEGCKTFEIDNSVTCRCTHLTFFAVLMVSFLHFFHIIFHQMRILKLKTFKCLFFHLCFLFLQTPINETISRYDLNTLTIITQVGCGLSVFFLSIVLFMHLILRQQQQKYIHSCEQVFHIVKKCENASEEC